MTQAHALLHGDEVAARRSKHKALPGNRLGRKLEKLEHLNSISGRAKTEFRDAQICPLENGLDAKNIN